MYFAFFAKLLYFQYTGTLEVSSDPGYFWCVERCPVEFVALDARSQIIYTYRYVTNLAEHMIRLLQQSNEITGT